MAAARKLLDEAGLKPGSGGERFAITFTHAANQQRLGQALRQQLRDVGITLNLHTMDFNAAVDQVFVKKTFDLGFASFCNGADPDIGVRRVYVSSNIGPFPFSNGAGYRNPRIDQLFDLGAQPADHDVEAVLHILERTRPVGTPYAFASCLRAMTLSTMMVDSPRAGSRIETAYGRSAAACFSRT